jgi:hypothetical protein
MENETMTMVGYGATGLVVLGIAGWLLTQGVKWLVSKVTGGWL